jgi:hypothetical protein
MSAHTKPAAIGMYKSRKCHFCTSKHTHEHLEVVSAGLHTQMQRYYKSGCGSSCRYTSTVVMVVRAGQFVQQAITKTRMTPEKNGVL